MKILLFCHLGLIREYAEYVTALKKVGPIDSILLTMGQEEYELGRELGVFDVVKNILPEKSGLDAAEANQAATDKSLRQLETRLGYEFVNRDILMDRHFQGQPRLDIDRKKMPLIWTGARARRFMHDVYKQVEAEIASLTPDFMFVETSFAPTRMAWRLAREKGIPAGGFMSVRFWPERLYLETGIGYDWNDARDAYKEISARPMTGAELAEVKERLDTFIEDKTKPAYLQTEHAKGAPNFLKRLFAMLTYSSPGNWLGANARTSAINPRVLPRKMFSPVAKFIRYRRGEKAKRFLRDHSMPFEKIRDKKYAVYFLHVEPEITVEGMAFDYQDQESTLRNVLACLPADTSLVVKEHSPMIGYRSLEAYSELAHMPGLIIVDSHEDSHKLITHASVVVTLTGTVALEAMLYGIPAVVLGSIYFDEFNGIYKPKGWGELKEQLSNPDELIGASREDALRTLGSMRRASMPGVPPRVDVSLQSIDPKSANEMMSELKRVCELR